MPSRSLEEDGDVNLELPDDVTKATSQMYPHGYGAAMELAAQRGRSERATAGKGHTSLALKGEPFTK